MKKADGPAPVGGSSLLVIFAVLCLAVFAVLSLSSVRAEGRLSTASAEAVRAYYAADCEAEEILAQLRAGIVPSGVIAEDNRYRYECTVSDTQKLVVEADFVSGNASKGWSTPAGTYPLTYKERNAKGQGRKDILQGKFVCR